jgi:hypothetical protein
VTESVSVFGFGSYFEGKPQPGDIDLLLLHRSANEESCRFVLECKSRILRSIPTSDVVMLSEHEASSLQFLDRAKTFHLGSVRALSLDSDIEAIVGMVQSHQACWLPVRE